MVNYRCNFDVGQGEKQGKSQKFKGKSGKKQTFRMKNRVSNRFLRSGLPLAALRSKWHRVSVFIRVYRRFLKMIILSTRYAIRKTNKGRRERDGIVSTKTACSWKQKSEIWKLFLFHTTQGLAAKTVSTILYFFVSNAQVGLIIEALLFASCDKWPNI